MIAVVAGFVVLIGADDDTRIRTNDPDSTTPSTSTVASTSVPAPTTASAPTTAPGAERGWTGGLLDDIDANSLRTLDSFTEGDVVVPTAPSGWRVSDSAWTDLDDAIAPDSSSGLSRSSRPHRTTPFGQVLYLTQSREPICRTTLGCTPSGESVTINGVEWESIVVERIPEDDDQFVDATTLRARVGDRWVSLAAGADQLLTGPLLENPPIIEFLEGLRVGSPSDLAAIGEACWQCDTAGAEGDPFAATGSPSAAPTTMPDGAPTATSDPGAQAPSDAGSETGRPLTDLAPGDVVVPTYIPPGLILQDTAQIYEYPGGVSEFSVSLETADGAFYSSVRLWDYGNDVGPLDPTALNDPEPSIRRDRRPHLGVGRLRAGAYRKHRAVLGLGLSGRSGPVGSRTVHRGVAGDPHRAVPQSDRVRWSRRTLGFRHHRPRMTLRWWRLTINSNSQLCKVGDRVCIKLEQTTVPVTMTLRRQLLGVGPMGRSRNRRRRFARDHGHPAPGHRCVRLTGRHGSANHLAGRQFGRRPHRTGQPGHRRPLLPRPSRPGRHQRNPRRRVHHRGRLTVDRCDQADLSLQLR